MAGRNHYQQRIFASLGRRCADEKYVEEPQQKSASQEFIADDQTEELGETSTAATMKIAARDEKMEIVRPDKGKQLVNVGGGGYRRDRPPEDDCCPICFDDFHVPCRTSCGHWFCSDCFLHLWRYMAKFKQCVCPICGSLIFNLITLPSSPIQPDEEVTQILQEIHRYNTQNMIGWFGIFKKAIALPQLTWRRLRILSDIIQLLSLAMRLIVQLHRIGYYDLHDFPNLFPDGMPLLIIFICTFALLTYVIWKRMMSIHRHIRLAEWNLNG